MTITLADIDRNLTLCFTGPRPQNLLKYPHIEDKAKITFKTVISRAYGQGYRFFISGGALAVDQWAAQVIIDTKCQDDYRDARLILARPFPSQGANWKPDQQAYFAWLCSQADLVVDVSGDPYHASKMHQRNAWMVDRSKSAVAIYDGRPTGGTANCVRYATSRIAVLIINPSDLISQKPGQVKAYWHFPTDVTGVIRQPTITYI